MSDKPSREDKRQKTAYYVYENMVTPSVKEMWETWVKHGGLKKYKRPALRTLEEWRSKYDWVARREAFQQKVKEEEQKKKLEAVIMKDEEILAITRTVMVRYGLQLHENKQGKIEFSDVEKAVKMQRLILGQPTEIGKHEVDVKDEYAELDDAQLLDKMRRVEKKFAEKLKQKNDKTDSS